MSDEFAPLLERKNVEFRAPQNIEAAEVHIDEAGLVLCLRNLVGNAIEHVPAGSAIEIGIEDKGSCVDVVIADEGSGIHAAEIENIKQRFVRGSRARGPGSGLGLSIIELVLERAGGELHLVNRAQSGLNAIMRFPAHRQFASTERGRPKAHLSNFFHRDPCERGGDVAAGELPGRAHPKC